MPGSKNPGTNKSQDFQNGETLGPKTPGTKIFKKSRDQKISKIPSCAHPYFISPQISILALNLSRNNQKKCLLFSHIDITSSWKKILDENRSTELYHTSFFWIFHVELDFLIFEMIHWANLKGRQF